MKMRFTFLKGGTWESCLKFLILLSVTRWTSLRMWQKSGNHGHWIYNLDILAQHVWAYIEFYYRLSIKYNDTNKQTDHDVCKCLFVAASGVWEYPPSSLDPQTQELGVLPPIQ